MTITCAHHAHNTPDGLNGDVYLNPIPVADAGSIVQLYGKCDVDLFNTTSSEPKVDDAPFPAWTR